MLAKVMTANVAAATVLLVCGLILMLLNIGLYNILYKTGIMLILISPLLVSAIVTVINLKKKQAKMAAVSLALFAVLSASIVKSIIEN